MDDAPLLSFITREQQKNTKKMRPLVILVFMEMMLMVAFLVISFSIRIHSSIKEEKYFILVYSHLVFWGIAIILERILKYYHRKLRLYGYFGVHKKTKKFNKTLNYVLSAGNLLLLTMTTVFENYCTTRQCKDTLFGGDFKRSPYMMMIFVLEFLVAQPLLIWYLAIIFQLMRSNILPDILYEDRIIGSPQSADLLQEVGSRTDVDTTEDLLERQANFIQFLQERNAVLAMKLQETRPG